MQHILLYGPAIDGDKDELTFFDGDFESVKDHPDMFPLYIYFVVDIVTETVDKPDDEPQPKLICAFALGRGEYCLGEVDKPHTHRHNCPFYKKAADDASAT